MTQIAAAPAPIGSRPSLWSRGRRVASKRRSPEVASRSIVVITVGLGIVSAYAIGRGFAEIPLLLAIGVLGISQLFRLSLYGWCVLLILATVVSRGPVAIGGLPQVLNFIHYPLVMAFGLAALMHASPRPRGRETRPSAWLLYLLGLCVASMAVSVSHPLRLVVFVMIVGEPLLVIWAIHRWSPDEQTLVRLGKLVLVIMAIQVPIGVFQGLALGWTDPVQGTLTGHGAGHHVLGGLFAVGLCLSVAALHARKVSRGRGLLAAFVCLAMIQATGSLSVMVAVCFAIVSANLLARPKGSRGGMRVGALVSGLVIAAGGIYSIEVIVPGTLTRAMDLVSMEDMPEIEITSERLTSDIPAAWFGSGPGTAASRASILLVADEFAEGSPLAALDLPPTELGLEYARKTRNIHGGSAEDYKSSTMSFAGDLGILGLIAVVAFIVSLVRMMRRRSNWIALGTLAAILMTAAISLIDNWLEYPEYTV
ncbi:MAG: hypothetical protein ACRDLB_04825, partial [Actinomycetota bacterium]